MTVTTSEKAEIFYPIADAMGMPRAIFPAIDRVLQNSFLSEQQIQEIFQETGYEHAEALARYYVNEKRKEGLLLEAVSVNKKS